MNIENNLIIWYFKGKITPMISPVTLIIVLKNVTLLLESFLPIYMLCVPACVNE